MIDKKIYSNTTLSLPLIRLPKLKKIEKKSKTKMIFKHKKLTDNQDTFDSLKNILNIKKLTVNSNTKQINQYKNISMNKSSKNLFLTNKSTILTEKMNFFYKTVNKIDLFAINRQPTQKLTKKELIENYKNRINPIKKNNNISLFTFFNKKETFNVTEEKIDYLETETSRDKKEDFIKNSVQYMKEFRKQNKISIKKYKNNFVLNKSLYKGLDDNNFNKQLKNRNNILYSMFIPIKNNITITDQSTTMMIVDKKIELKPTLKKNYIETYVNNDISSYSNRVLASKKFISN